MTNQRDRGGGAFAPAPSVLEGGAPRPSILSARPDITTEVTRGVMRHFIDLGYTPLAEFALANGRRADVIGLDQRGHIIIAEVKSCKEDFEVDAKWQDYTGFCDSFYFAVPQVFPVDCLPPEEGLIFADAYGGAVVRPGVERKLAPARRKAVTLRFARNAAGRLLRMGEDPAHIQLSKANL